MEAYVKERNTIKIEEKKHFEVPTGITKYGKISYWAKFFDVPTKVVVRRMGKAIFPFLPGSIFAERYFEPESEPLMKEKLMRTNTLRREFKFDLWGPVWIMFTLVVFSFVFAHFSKQVEVYFGV